MKVVVIGGSDLIGSKLVAKLGERGHETAPATGDGLAEVLEGAAVVVNMPNARRSPTTR